MASLSCNILNSPILNEQTLLNLQQFLEFMTGPQNGHIALPSTRARYIQAIKALMNKRQYALDYYTSFRENLKERSYLLPTNTELIKMIDSVCGELISDYDEYEEEQSGYEKGTHRTLMHRSYPDKPYDARFEFCKVLYIAIYRA